MSAPAYRANPSSAAEPTGPTARPYDFALQVFAVEQPDAILVIDDEPSVADAVRLILEDRGHRVLVAASGGRGLDLARAGGVRFVITDLRLPDLSGLELLCTLRAEQPQLPIVLITSHAAPDLHAEARRAGALAVLPKPFVPADLLDLVDGLR